MAAWTLPQRIAEWCEVLSAGLDRRSRKYFVSIVLGMLLASGRRTVSSWLRAAGVLDDWQDHDYFLQTLGRRAGRVATELLGPGAQMQQPLAIAVIGGLLATMLFTRLVIPIGYVVLARYRPTPAS